MAYNITNSFVRQAGNGLKRSFCVKIVCMKKFAYILTIVGLCFIINSLLHSIYDLWHKQDLVVSAQKQLVQEEQKSKNLQAQYKYSQTQQFIEEQAHDKLFLEKPGEQEVLFSQAPEGLDASKKSANIPNWQQWLNLFF